MGGIPNHPLHRAATFVTISITAAITRSLNSCIKNARPLLSNCSWETGASLERTLVSERVYGLIRCTAHVRLCCIWVATAKMWLQLNHALFTSSLSLPDIFFQTKGTTFSESHLIQSYRAVLYIVFRAFRSFRRILFFLINVNYHLTSFVHIAFLQDMVQIIYNLCRFETYMWVFKVLHKITQGETR